MVQHTGASSSGQDSVVDLHLKSKGRSFDDQNVPILDKEDRWLERVIMRAVFVKREMPLLNKGVQNLSEELSESLSASDLSLFCIYDSCNE